MSGEQASRFTLVYLDRVRAVLEQLVVRAIQEGQRQWLAQVLLRLQERLELDPLAFGEPLYYLPNARLHIRAGGVSGLVFLFSVDSERRYVYLIECLPPARLGD